MKPELETSQLDTYTTANACALLDYMATVKKLNENTLVSVKSLCRGIFATATRKDIIKINPWREAKESVKVRPAKTRIYSTNIVTQSFSTANLRVRTSRLQPQGPMRDSRLFSSQLRFADRRGRAGQ